MIGRFLVTPCAPSSNPIWYGQGETPADRLAAGVAILPAVVTHPADLATDIVEPVLDAVTLIRAERTAVVPVRLPDPVTNAVQLMLGAIGLVRIEAAIATASVYPVLKELDALAWTIRRTTPESTRIPTTVTRRRGILCVRRRRGQ